MSVNTWNPGTHVALLGTVAFTLPSLLSMYHRDLGLPDAWPCWLSAQHRDGLMFVYQAHPSPSRWISPSYTLFTHVFHHQDILHWASNVFGLFSIGSSLNLGFCRTLIVLYGGAIAGVATHVAEWTFLRRSISSADIHILPPSISGPESNSWETWWHGAWHLGARSIQYSVNWATWIGHRVTGNTTVPIPEWDASWPIWQRVKDKMTAMVPVYLGLCGASAMVYSLMGAETVTLIFRYQNAKAVLTSLKRGSPDWLRKRDEVHAILAWTLLRGAEMMSQVVFMMLPEMIQWGRGQGVGIVGSTSSIHRSPQVRRNNAGYSAHLGGYIFGVVAALIFRLI